LEPKGSTKSRITSLQSGVKMPTTVAAAATISSAHAWLNVPRSLTGARLSMNRQIACWTSPTVYRRFWFVQLWARKFWLMIQFTKCRFSGNSIRPAI
jgi:hypothetical protein